MGDLDFDGKDEVFGDYVAKTESVFQNETTTTVTTSKQIIKFNLSGVPAGTGSVEIDTNTDTTNSDLDKFSTVPGRFLGSRQHRHPGAEHL